MKKLVLTIALLAVAAGAAYAYVQVSPLPDASSQAPSKMTTSMSGDDGGLSGAPSRQPSGTTDTRPTRPVPEPGTMALASMGLLALGIAAHRRRSRS